MTNVAMHHIFISYANQDRAAAEMIARTLETRGWGVWWDRNIPPGRSFDEVIGEALDRASCVVVLWSRASVSSEWVKEEAAEGARRKILVPVMIEDVPIPLGFRRVQAANLIGWQGSSDDPEFNGVLKAVARLLGKTPVEPPALENVRPGSQRSSRDVAVAMRATNEVKPTRLRLARRWLASAATLLGAFVGGFGAGAAMANVAGSDEAGFIAAIPTWLGGLWLTAKVWRRLR